MPRRLPGADALSLINTLLGMAIDVRTRKPLLSRVVGGLSGPCVKPVALRMVWECHKAVKVPLLGMGGICTGVDAVEFMLAGATAVAVGTANFMNPAAGRDVVEGIRAYCEEQGVDDVNELIGGSAMLTRFDSIPASERIIVALDMDAFEAYALAERCAGAQNG